MGDRKLQLEDLGDYVTVGLEGDESTRCYVDYQFSLLFGDTGALVVIETPFSILGKDGEQGFEPTKWAKLGPALERLLFKKSNDGQSAQGREIGNHVRKRRSATRLAER